MVSVGDKVKDPITGLTGIVVARTEWLWQCVRIGVQPQEMKDGKPVDEAWFDEDRVVVVEAGAFTAINKKKEKPTGGPKRETDIWNASH